jgi:mono/diheme cytochrome c family protein
VKFLLGLILGLALFPVGAYIYFATGQAPVATADPDMPFEKFIVRKALHARLEGAIPKDVPIQADEANYLAGANLYKQHCAVCHGLPETDKTAIATGMYPRPPQLFKGKGVTDDPAGESYWKISNGIRLTGMPAFNKSLSETQMWQMAILLANADKVPPAVRVALVTQPGPPQQSATPPPAKTPKR